MSDRYLKLQHRKWWARFQVPNDVRETFGKSEEWISLGTEDRKMAEARVHREAANFRARVLEARGKAGTIEEDALYWRKLIENEPQDENSNFVVYDAAVGVASDKFVKGGRKAVARFANVHHEGNEVEALLALGGPKARTFVDIALVGLKPLAPFVAPWAARRKTEVEAKTAQMDRTAVERFVKRFPLASDVTKSGVGDWIQARKTNDEVSARTVAREVTGIRTFWTYLQERGEIGEDASDLLSGLRFNDRRKDVARAKRERFTPEEVAALYKEAQAVKDTDLASLIMLAAYTGARREELCALGVEDVAKGWIAITDAKTDAGSREVPVHPRITSTLAALTGKRRTGYVFAELDENKHGARGDAIGKRFARMKTRMGHGATKTFHSIRHTFTNMLETMGVAENLTADLVGHAKTTMSYGVYSGRGATRGLLAAAIGKVKYPKPL